MKTRLSILVLLILVAGLSACANATTGAKIEIHDPWVRAVGAMDKPAEEHPMESGMATTGAEEMPAETTTSNMIGSTGAAFLTIKNSTQGDDKLVAAASDVADAVEIHISEVKDDVMTMRQVDGIEVPAGGEVILKPGSYHIMLIGLNRNLAVGDTVNLTLTFEKAGPLNIEAEVRAMP